jgi:hypothetical protein
MWKFNAVLCVLVPWCANATTLVALWTPERVLMAADSRVVFDNGTAADGCKIGHSGTTWFAVAGLVSDTGSGYALSSLLRDTMAGGGELSSKMDRFIVGVQPALSNAVAALRRDDPEQFAVFTGGPPILQAILADTADGYPVIMTVSFSVNGNGALQPHTSRIDGSDLMGPRIIYAGQQDRIRAYLRAHRDWIAGDNAVLVQKLVQVEVDANTPWVGGPIDVLEINGRGTRWLQAKSACVDPAIVSGVGVPVDR